MAETYPGNTIRSVRVDDPTWDAAKARAAREGTSVSAVIVAFLIEYAAEEEVQRSR